MRFLFRLILLSCIALRAAAQTMPAPRIWIAPQADVEPIVLDAVAIRTHNYGDHRQSLTGPISLQVEFQTDFGRAKSNRQTTIRRLESSKEAIGVGQFRVAPEDRR